VDRKLKDLGYKKSDPFRKYRKFSDITEGNDVKAKRKISKKIGIRKKAKVKRAKNKEFNIFQGTKKALTYELSKDLWGKKGKEISEVKALVKQYGDKMVERVQKKFPEAQEKSVKIWMSRALKEIATK
jgi:hypothetical protein